MNIYTAKDAGTVAALQSRIRELEAEVESLRTLELDTYEQLGEVHKERDALEARIRELESEPRPLLDLLSNLREENASLRDENKSLQEQVLALRVTATNLRAGLIEARGWIKDGDSLSAFEAIQDALRELDKAASVGIEPNP